ncbi:hypothetical protein BgiMline_008301 [Biomphalaria glabrata]|nr:cell death specification protein 2-like [Biomphalaria glabrata]KAI8788825.1 cell death specification protein 2 [Biomphalaria glabrata]
MAFKLTNIHHERSTDDSNEGKGEAAEGQSISSVLSRSCHVLEDFEDLACHARSTTCQNVQARSTSYLTHDDDKLSKTDCKFSTNSDMIPSITDHSENSYNALCIDSINNETFFEIPSAGFTSCNLLAPTDPNFMESNISRNSSITDWSPCVTGDSLYNVRHPDSNGSSMIEENRNTLGQLKCTSNFNCSPQIFEQSNPTCYGNLESQKVYDADVPNFYQQNHQFGHFGGNRTSSTEYYNGETDQSSCVMQNVQSWRPNYSLQYQVGKSFLSSTGNIRPECCPDELLCRNYYNDASLFDSRFQHSSNTSDECLLASPNQSTSPVITLDGHYIHAPETSDTSEHFLMVSNALTNSKFQTSGRCSLETEHLDDRVSDTNKTEASLVYHYGKAHRTQGTDIARHSASQNMTQGTDIARHSASQNMTQGTDIARHSASQNMTQGTDVARHSANLTNQEMELSHDDRTSRKNSVKVKSKKPDSVESLQHQLELLEEKRRMGSMSRQFRYQLGASDDEKSGKRDLNSIIDVDHMISSGVTVAGFKPRAIIRKRSKSNTPSDVKNQEYWHKRRKNNDSARKSRESKKEKEKNFYKRALELEYENVYLLECLNLAEAELASLGRQFMPPAFDQDSYY